MKVLIYSMSLNGEYSITLHSTRYLQDVFTKKGDTFEEVVIPKNGVLSDDALEKFKEADLVMIITSMYHFLIASQAMESLVTIGNYLKQNRPDVPVTYFMTSNFLMDVLVHDYIGKWARRYGLRLIKGISFFSEDVLEERYRADLYAWFNNIKALVSSDKITAARKINAKIVILDETAKTGKLAGQYRKALTDAGAEVRDVNMCRYDFKHCLGCQYCYTTRVCCIKDDFNRLCEDIEADTDIAVYVGAIENGFYPSVFKRFMDRHVCIGRCPDDDEIITLYAYREGPQFVQGDENLFKTWADACTSFGGEILAGVCRGFDQSAVDAAVAAFNENIAPYRDFYGTALRTRFGDLAREIQNVEPLDYKFFDSIGQYNVRPVNQNCRPITSAQSAKMAVEMKSMSVRAYRTQGGSVEATIPERRKDRRSLIARAIDPVYKDHEVKPQSGAAAAPPKSMGGGANPMRKIGRRMGLIMNTFNTIIFSTIGTLRSGHFTWKDWFIGACIGWITGAIITSLVPPKEVSDWVLAKTKTSGDSAKGKILTSLSTNLIIMPVMTIVMGIAMPMMSAYNLERNISTMQTEVIELQTQQSDLKSQQSDLIEQRYELISKQDALKSEQTALKTSQSALKDQQAALKDKMQQTIDETLASALAERQEALEKLTASKAELQTQYDSMKADVDDLQKKLDAATSPAEKGPISGQLEGKTKALEEMGSGLEEQQKAIDELNASIEASKKEIPDSIANGSDGKAGMQSGIDEMQKGIDDQQAGIDDQQKGIDEMQSGIDEMQSGIDGMQGGIDGMQNGIDGKSQGIEAQKTAVSEIKTSIRKTLPLSVLLMSAIGITLGFIFQPLFLKLVMRSVFGKKAP